MSVQLPGQRCKRVVEVSAYLLWASNVKDSCLAMGQGLQWRQCPSLQHQTQTGDVQRHHVRMGLEVYSCSAAVCVKCEHQAAACDSTAGLVLACLLMWKYLQLKELMGQPCKEHCWHVARHPLNNRCASGPQPRVHNGSQGPLISIEVYSQPTESEAVKALLQRKIKSNNCLPPGGGHATAIRQEPAMLHWVW